MGLCWLVLSPVREPSRQGESRHTDPGFVPTTWCFLTGSLFLMPEPQVPAPSAPCWIASCPDPQSDPHCGGGKWRAEPPRQVLVLQMCFCAGPPPLCPGPPSSWVSPQASANTKEPSPAFKKKKRSVQQVPTGRNVNTLSSHVRWLTEVLYAVILFWFIFFKQKLLTQWHRFSLFSSPLQLGDISAV